MKTLASVLMVLIGAVICMASDLLIRAQELDSLYGIDAQSWDVYGSITMVLGMGGFVWCLARKE